MRIVFVWTFISELQYKWFCKIDISHIDCLFEWNQHALLEKNV